jgi:hypothetical protein
MTSSNLIHETPKNASTRNGNLWSDAEIAILDQTYCEGADECQAALRRAGYTRGLDAIRYKAHGRNLKVSAHTTRAKRAEAASKTMQAKGGRDGLFKVRAPFETLDPEYIKVSSIFRVGQRYGAQA